MPIPATSSSTSTGNGWRSRLRPLPIAAFVVAAAFLLFTRDEPYRANWGDPWSDANVMTSGRYFASHGFIETAFTPTIDVGERNEESLKYTHYPPLPDIVNGVQQSLFGRMSIGEHRIFADLLSLLSLIFFYRFVRRMFSARIADYALPLYAINLLWFQYADTIHHVPLYWCAGYFALDMATAWLAERRRRQLWGLGIGAAFCMLASYDFVFYLPTLIAAAVWCDGKRLRDREVRPLVIASVLGVGGGIAVKFLLVIWAIGLTAFIHDMIFQFEERATRGQATSYRDGLLWIVGGRFWRFFSPAFFVVLYFVVQAAWRRRKGLEGRVSPRSGWLLAAGLPFCLLFNQLFAEQYHPTLQLLPFYAVATATCIVAMRDSVSRRIRVLGLALFAFLVAWQVRQVASFPKVLVPEADLYAVGDYLQKVDGRRFVITNFYVDAPVRNYWHRHAFGIPFTSGKEVTPYLSSVFADYGPEPIRFVEFDRPEELLYDKLLYGFFASRKKWAWIGFPSPTASWKRTVAEGNAKVVEELRKRAVREVTVGRFTVYRIDASAGDREFVTPDLGDLTTDIDLADPLSIRTKLYGFGHATPDGAKLVGRPLKQIRFTLKGIVKDDAGTDFRAVVQANVYPSRTGNRVTVRVRAQTPGVLLRLRLNSFDLGARALTADWADVTMEIPLTAFSEEDPQTLALSIEGANPAPQVDVARITFDQD